MSEIEKNTVSAVNQVRNGNITVQNENGTYPRVMFVGNSITRHGIRHEIGWHNDFGMAASSIEKDYVHILEKRILEKHPDAAFCICQASAWERGHVSPDYSLETMREARDFGADIIIFRIIENVSGEGFDSARFRRCYRELIAYLNGTGKAKVYLTTGFWHHVGDPDILAVAREDGLPVAELGALGDDPEMKALGLFEHSGVANHPGDKGMLAIADAIWAMIEKNI